jgi:cellobiose phosphorylase
VFEHTEAGIHSEMTTFVAVDAPIKYTVLKVRNDSLVQRRLSAFGYGCWATCAPSPACTSSPRPIRSAARCLPQRLQHRVRRPRRLLQLRRLAAHRHRRPHRIHRPQRHAGRTGGAAPFAPVGKVGAGLDACAAIQAPFDLLPGQEREIVFVLGVGGRRNADASSLVQKHRTADAAHEALAAVHAHWEKTLGAVRIKRRSANWT